MDIKTFEAFSMRDAVKSIKKSLGNNAVILSTKERPGPKGKGIIYEVTAASPDRAKQMGASVASSREAGFDRHVESMLDGISVRMTVLQDATATKRQVSTIEAGMQELKTLLLENLRGKDGSSIKDLPEALVGIDRQLRIMGVDDTSIAGLMRHLRSLPAPDKSTLKTNESVDEHYRDQAIRWMMKRIRIAPRWTIASGDTNIQAVVGSTGVGKSATVAKLAAHYHLREKAKVLVVSFDNQRLAASDQMRIYCKIIGVPFLTISEAEELPEILRQNRETELCLIDTAGRSAKNSSAAADLLALKELATQVEFNLCLSVTEKESQLDQAVRTFSPLGLQSLIFSKLDESWSFGEIYNLSKKWSLPLSFFTIGQQVPDDLERATRERVIERIFGL